MVVVVSVRKLRPLLCVASCTHSVSFNAIRYKIILNMIGPVRGIRNSCAAKYLHGIPGILEQTKYRCPKQVYVNHDVNAPNHSPWKFHLISPSHLHTNKTHRWPRRPFSTLWLGLKLFQLNLIPRCLSFYTVIHKWTPKLCHDCIVHPLTGSSEAPEGNGRQSLWCIAIGVCVPLEAEVKAANDDYRKAVYIYLVDIDRSWLRLTYSE